MDDQSYERSSESRRSAFSSEATEPALQTDLLQAEATKLRPKGLAISAIIIGGIAFLIGWTPFFGLIAGATAVIFGIVALLKRQPKALGIIGIMLGGVAALTSIVLTVFVLASTDWNAVETAPKAEQTAAEPAPSAKPKTTPKPTQDVPKVTSKPEKKQTPKPEPSTPPPSVETTSGGMTAGMAEVACENTAREVFPYGVEVRWFAGMIAERLENDAWFIKVEVTPTTEDGTKVDGMVMECTVTGSESAPQIVAFDAY